MIESVPRATNQGGRGGRGQWRVRFAPRRQPVADPLTGWTGGGDPLGTIELRFSDLETAAGYCRRQGLDFSLHGAPPSEQDSPSRSRRSLSSGCAREASDPEPAKALPSEKRSLCGMKPPTRLTAAV
ncbi:NADH dehydrogenase ubiquinone Fe-S protein 4 [Sphingobium sp. SJ10-10]|uniref:NADH dehydrogenase ubiquinone Fe-S protein 4 n=1 Tax=unclassified Sphingobium TaxID=2611147 RepID=UPI001F5B6141|nr:MULTISPECIES: NADH dehydrogenase ubiquinone Fe-S protein 4 [unclassified Sphingobium]MEC6699242.1 NADH dehydrogenase ubiquinone Fe-S protein 4 [Sphingobium sp. SJ10-10]